MSNFKYTELEMIYNKTMLKLIDQIVIIRNDRFLLTEVNDYMKDIMIRFNKNIEKRMDKQERLVKQLKKKKIPKISKNAKSINQVITIRPNKNSIDQIYKCNICGLCNIDREIIIEHKETHREYDDSELEIKVEGNLIPLELSGNITMKQLKPYLSVKQLRNVKDYRTKTINGKSLRLPLQLQTIDKSEIDNYKSRLDFNSNIYYVSGSMRLNDGNTVYRIFHSEKS